MCRMLGWIAGRAVSAREQLRGLRELSLQHADGWGIATRAGAEWSLKKSVACAARCCGYDDVLAAESTIAIAHVRKKTVGETSVANTHPFRRGPFVFAHNGTVKDVAAVMAGTSAQRLAEIEGQTDSEKLFAFVLTHVDRAGGDVERGARAAVGALAAMGDGAGAATFLLSCGSRLYAHRLGRALFTHVADGVAMTASEPLGGLSWLEVPERSLVVLDAASVRIA